MDTDSATGQTPTMTSARTILAAILLTPASLAEVQAVDDARAINAHRDQAREQERQANELRRLRHLEADHARQEDRDRRNAARGA